MKRFARIAAAGVLALCVPAAASAEPGGVSEAAFVLNSLFLLICGALVMFMAAGFTLLEAGSVRAKSVGAILLKNICLYAIAGLMFYFIGYQLLFSIEAGGLLGTPGLWQATAAADHAARPPYADNAIWFFQMVFVATAASVVSGCLAERIKLWPFLAFTALLTGIIYPIVGSWTWGGGWLAELGFSDFAGSTIVHSVGGWAALAGAILLGARRGRFDGHEGSLFMPYSSAPQVALGVLILWFGWFGFNGGSRLSFSSIEDAEVVATIFANTNAAAAAGVLTALIVTRLVRGKPSLLLALNGTIAGLVAITAGPATPSMGLSACIGAGGSLVMLGCAHLLEKCRIDDVVGAIPAHLAAGIFGTIVVAFTNPDATLGVQLLGIAVIGAFTFGTSFAAWYALRATVGIRLAAACEHVGADHSELGSRAYHLSFDDEPVVLVSSQDRPDIARTPEGIAA